MKKYLLTSIFILIPILAAFSQPASPVLTEPPNLENLVSKTVTLDWIDVTSADQYLVQLSQSADFSGLDLYSNNTSVSEFPVPAGVLSANKTYYWRVRASNSYGSGDFSVSRSFTTDSPVLTEPPKLDIMVEVTPTLNWLDVPTATGYDVQVSTDSFFTSLVTLSTSVVTVSQLTLLPNELSMNTVYYWRVRASNSSRTSDFSDPFSFRTVGTPVQEINNVGEAVDKLVNSNQLSQTQAIVLNNRLEGAVDFLNRGSEPQAILRLMLFNLHVTILRYSNQISQSNAFTLVNNVTRIILLIMGDKPMPLPEITMNNKFSLGQNYPNPFNPVTSIEYSVPRDGYVSLKVYDITGREITSLVDKYMQSGTYISVWNASNYSSGVYIYRLVSGSYSETKRMLLVK